MRTLVVPVSGVDGLLGVWFIYIRRQAFRNMIALYVNKGDCRYSLRPVDSDNQSPESTTNRGFFELQEVTFQGPACLDWRLLVDDVPLDSVADSPGEWKWTPGYYAGEVDVEMRNAKNKPMGRWRLDVYPDPNKVSHEVFQQMLKEILCYNRALAIGQEPAQRQFGTLDEFDNPIIEFYRLRSRVEPIDQSLAAVIREPVQTLHPRRHLTLPHLVRRADRQSARAALRQPLLLAIAGVLPREQVPFTQPPVVDTPAVEYHYDNPANRCLFYMLQQLQRQCSKLMKELQEDVEKEDPPETETALAPRWPVWEKELGQLHQCLEKASRQLPFRDVTRPEVTAAGLNAVAAHPLYAQFWRVGWEALRRGIAGQEPVDWLPLNPTWGIYERWCFVKISRWVKQLFPEMVWIDPANRADGEYQSIEGESIEGDKVRLQFQKKFNNTKGKKKEFWSISSKRIPDIILDWTIGNNTGFLIFDAKYTKNVLNKMETAHIYNDSLRMYHQRPAASILLVPTAGGAPWLEKKDFIAENRVGVLPLHPDLEPPQWFEDWVRDTIFKQTT